MNINGELMKKILIVTFLLSLGIIIGLFVQPTLSGDSVATNFKKYQYIFNTAFTNYVKDLDPNKLTEGAIKGMLSELDVHSVYISPDEKKEVDEDFQGHFFGIGIQFDVIQDSITVITPLAGGPSEKLGILALDKIVKIDGQNAVGIPRNDVPRKLKGPKDTKVVVEIYRNGVDSLIKFEIIRDQIPDWSLDSRFMIDGTDIGYVKLSRFSATTHEEMMNAIKELKAKGMKNLILDLRYNPGGFLSQAYRIAQEFLDNGDTIVYTRGRRSEFNENLIARYTGGLRRLPLIVLINQNSASASEIVSGSMQDLDRGLVVGETSFGKGLVQRQYDYDADGSAFRITISYYYTASGRSIQRPFEDGDAYRSLEGRLNLKDGATLEDAIAELKKVKKDSGENIDSLIYKTRKGRKVFAGGGITPDHIVKGDTSKLQDMTVKIRMTRISTIFADHYLLKNKKLMQTKYPDFTSFYHNFNLSKNDWNEFRKLVEDNKIEWKEKDFEKDKDYLQTMVMADMALINWSRHEQRQVYTKYDRQLLEAIKLFPEAKKLVSF